MDKEYLIHNIDYKDNPEDQHQTIDITISDLELTAQDLTATIGLDMYVNGAPAGSSKYEDVSLTGAGGDGGMEDFQEVSVEIIPTIGGEPLNKTITENTLECGSTRDYSPAIDNMIITTTGNINIGKLPILKNGETLLLDIYFLCSDESVYYWVKNSTPTITGDAEYIPQSGGNPAKIKIWGDCALTIEVEPE